MSNHRCKMPVVIVGETGCGKTSLLRFLCSLISQALKIIDAAFEFNNFRSLKVSLIPIMSTVVIILNDFTIGTWWDK